MHNGKTLVVVSHYDRRPKEPLDALIGKLKSITSEIVVVINDDDLTSQHLKISQSGVRTLFRPNIGMNIGSWDAGYRAFPNYDFYIFMQDECLIQRGDFIEAYEAELSRNQVGMTGESINPKWNLDWNSLSRSPLNYFVPGSEVNGTQVPRVNFYYETIKKWGISPGLSGRHLRSIIWAFNKICLEQIDGFPVGGTKEECIASEIAVFKKVEQMGFNATQISNTPFEYIYHTEWQRNGVRKIPG